ncbi:MAG: SIMPL domain-containing protein [Sulfitobacter sp.]
MKIFRWAASVWILCTGLAFAQMPEQGIIVTGEGRISAVPDMATITLGVRENANTAKEAMGKVTTSVSAILEQLDTLGVAQKDRQTSRFYLNPVYNNSRSSSGEDIRKVTGYEAGNAVTVTVRDLTALGDMLDAVIDIGANDFNGLSFGLQDPAPAMALARKVAVADAIARANQLATAASLNLGTVLRMTENSQGPAPMAMEMAAARSGLHDAIAGGEVDIQAQVTMVFAIAPGN